MKLAVTVDTEADGQWNPGIPITTRNTAYWEPFQDLCDRHGIAPTYLITSEIAEDHRARDLLHRWEARGAAEVGAHLHPWTTPPFFDRPGLRFNDSEHAFPCQLPDELLREKTTRLTTQITEAFGKRPTSYRAGRFGLDRRLARFLADDGYVVDSSVTPRWSWRSYPGMAGKGGPDFRSHTPRPFAIRGSGPRGLLEIPVTLVATYDFLRRWPLLLDAYRSLPVRAARKIFASRWLAPQPIWLTPDPRYRDEDLQAAWRYGSATDLEAAVMILHSSELMPGGSPFRPDAESVRDLLDCLDTFFAYVRGQGDGFATLGGLADTILAGPPPEERSL